jgi:hypothetical protein
LYYYVLKQRRKRYTENWQPVSLYDSEGYFRGQAIFETEKEARKYMKIYQLTLQVRNEQNHSNNQDRKIRIDLKIFKESEKPQISSYPSFYFKRRRYN